MVLWLLMLSRGLPLIKSFFFFNTTRIFRGVLIKTIFWLILSLFSFSEKLMRTSARNFFLILFFPFHVNARLNHSKHKSFLFAFLRSHEPRKSLCAELWKNFFISHKFFISTTSPCESMAQYESRSWREIKKKNKISKWMFLAFYWMSRKQFLFYSTRLRRQIDDKHLRERFASPSLLVIVCLTSMKTTK